MPARPTQTAAELEALHRAIRLCRRCRLHRSRTLAVPGEGPCDAPVMLIGEAPGAAEDKTGRPFVGRSGQFLNGILAAAGLDRYAIYITASVKCRPPQNRTPRADELTICKTAWLLRQIDLVNPRLIILAGGVAVRQVLGRTDCLHTLRCKKLDHAGRRVIVTYHPAAAMRFPEKAAAMREDLEEAARG